MKNKPLLWIVLALAVLAGAGLAWWLLQGPSETDDAHAHIAHLPHDAPPPTTRGPPATKMKEVRAALHKQLAARGFKPGSPIYVRVFKHSRQFEVWMKKGRRFHLFHTFPICYFSGELGPKLKRGDFQAPEGFYRVARRQLNPRSSYHLSFNVGYPNRYDRKLKRTGSAIMVHGSCVSAGCFAMTDAGVERIYALAEDALKGGQKAFSVHIFPFRMTAENIKRFDKADKRAFWQELQAGYEAFEQTKVPPVVKVRHGLYQVEGRG